MADLPKIVQKIVVETDADRKIEALTKRLESFGLTLNSTQGDADTFARVVDKLGAAAAGGARDVDTSTAKVDRFGKAIDQSAFKTGKAADGFGSLSKGLKDAARSADVAKDAVAEVGDKLEDAADAARTSGDEASRSGGKWDDLGRSLRRFGFSAASVGFGLEAIGKVLGTLKLPAILAATGPLASGLSAIAGAAVAVTGAVGQSLGVLGALPAILAAGATAAATLVTGFKGIGTALSAGFKAQSGGGGGGGSGVDRQEQIEQANQRLIKSQEAVENARYQSVVAAERLEDAERDLVKATAAVGEAEERAAERVVDAEKEIVRRRKAVDDTVERAARRIEDADDRAARAETRLTEAQDRSFTAQERLARARQDAREELEDYARAAESASVAEAQAQDRVEESLKAQQAAAQRVAQVRAVLARGGLSDRNRADLEARLAQLIEDEADAALNLRDANLALNTATDQREDSARDLTDAIAKGEEGTYAFTSAVDEARNASEALADAQQEVQDALRDQARAAEDAAQMVEDANAAAAQAVRDYQDAIVEGAEAVEDAKRAEVDAYRSVRDAQRAQIDAARSIRDAEWAAADAVKALDKAMKGATGGGGGVDAFNKAMENLTPTAQAFVRAVLDLKPRLSEIRKGTQEALFPGFLDAIGYLSRPQVLGTVTKLLGDMAGALSDVVRSLSFKLTSDGFLGQLSALSGTNTEIIWDFGEALGSLVRAFVNVAQAGSGLALNLSEAVAQLGAWAETASRAGLRSGRLAEFFERAWERAKQLGRILSDLTVGLGGVFKAAAPLGDSLVDSLESLTGRFRDFTTSAVGQEKLTGFFNDLRPVLSEIGGLIGDVSRAFVDLSVGSNGRLLELVKLLREDLVPVLLKVLTSFSESDFLTKIGEIATAFGEIFANTASSFGAILDVLTPMAQALADMVKYVPGVAELVSIIAILGGSLKGVGIAAGLVGFKDFDDKIVALTKNFVKARLGIDDVAKGAAEAAGSIAGKGGAAGGGLTAALGGLTPWVVGIGAAVAVGAFAWSQYSKRKAEAKARTEEMVKALSDETKTLDENLQTVIDKRVEDKNQADDLVRLGVTYDDVSNAVRGNDDALNALIRRLKETKEAEFFVATGRAAVTRATDEQIAAYLRGEEVQNLVIRGNKGLAETYRNLSNDIREGSKAAFENLVASGKITENQARLFKQQATLEDGTVDYTTAVDNATRSLREREQAEKDLEDRMNRSIDAVTRKREATQDLNDLESRRTDIALELLNLEARGLTQSPEYLSAKRQERDIIEEIAQRQTDLEVATREANGQKVSDAEKTMIQVEALRQQAEALAPGSPLRQDLLAYARELESKVPKELRTQITLTAQTDQAELAIQASLDRLTKLINGLPYTVATNRLGPKIALAAGGIMKVGSVDRGPFVTRDPVLVGEDGSGYPEFVIPTNPAYRDRARALFGILGEDLGLFDAQAKALTALAPAGGGQAAVPSVTVSGGDRVGVRIDHLTVRETVDMDAVFSRAAMAVSRL